MKNTWNKAGLALLSGSLLLASCDKEDTGEIEGAAPTADFTAAVNTTEFPTVVTFTNTSQNSFL
jgi:PKD repeat protein